MGVGCWVVVFLLQLEDSELPKLTFGVLESFF